MPHQHNCAGKVNMKAIFGMCWIGRRHAMVKLSGVFNMPSSIMLSTDHCHVHRFLQVSARNVAKERMATGTADSRQDHPIVQRCETVVMHDGMCLHLGCSSLYGVCVGPTRGTGKVLDTQVLSPLLLSVHTLQQQQQQQQQATQMQAVRGAVQC